MSNELEKAFKAGDLGKTIDLLGKQKVQEQASEAAVSRVAKNRQYLDVNAKLRDEDKDLFDSIGDVFGTSLIPDKPRELSQLEIDSLARSFFRYVLPSDVLKGRQEALRSHALDAITATQPDDIPEPEYAPGELKSEAYNIRLCKEVTGGKSYAAWDELESVLDDEIWSPITDEVTVMTIIKHPNGTIEESENVTHQVNDDAVLEAMKKDKITLEHLQHIMKLTPRVQKFTVKPLVKEDK